jgi:FlaA1/EpsC-like NDP-sugar epimerase
VRVLAVPTLAEIRDGRVSIGALRPLAIEDLLGRVSAPPDPAMLAANVAGKCVLVTGAGGSIGSELCRQVLALGPRELVLVDNGEFNLFRIDAELNQRLDARAPGSLRPVLHRCLASVTDAVRIDRIIARHRPDTVYHAAAYKHVPLVEHNVAEGVANNTLGTRCVALAAMACGVQHVVLISTDKAVRPTNVMGASKRMAELVLQALAARGDHSTVFCMVRFGNVLGSSGSVVPLFRRQIRSGGPITLTHPDVTRYFMTIPEAAQLVLQAGGMAQGGEVFVLDMGKPVRIGELAERMVRLSGLTVRSEDNPQGDIAIEITGLRPGEKLYEELLIGDDPQPTQHPRIWQAREDFLPWVELEPVLGHLQDQAEKGDEAALRQTLARHVSGFVSGLVSSPPSAAG